MGSLQVWQLLGLPANPPYPENCEVAVECAGCGSPRVFHDHGIKRGDRIYCDEVCWRQDNVPARPAERE